MKVKIKFIFFMLIILFINLFSCHSSFYYPEEKIIEITKEKIKKETDKDVDVFFSNTTLYIKTNLNGSLTRTLEVPEDVYNIIQTIVLISTNIAISTDAKINFFVVIIDDDVKKLKLIFKQNIVDTKKWIYGLLGREDFQERSLFDIKIYDEEENITYPEIFLEDFIMEQTIAVVRTKIKKELKMLAEIIKKEAKNRIDMLKKTGTIPDDIVENIKELIKTNNKYKYLDIYINFIKDFAYKKDTKIFEYNFKSFSDENQNFPLVDYDLIGNLICDTNEAICKKYDFLDYKKIVLIENTRIVFSSYNYEKSV